MEESTSKEKVLKSVREALISKTDQPFPKLDMDKYVYREMQETPDVNFAQELTHAGGIFVYCQQQEEAIEGIRFLMAEHGWENVYATESFIIELLQKGQISYTREHDELKTAQVAITGCESLIARLGSVMVSSGHLKGRQIFASPETHVVIAHTSQLVNDLKEAFAKLRKKYDPKTPSMVTLITGPSRTADIEKTLVMGVHGPKELYVFLLEDLI
jgi:L-lactate dehydrogenase complex protein LldG